MAEARSFNDDYLPRARRLIRPISPEDLVPLVTVDFPHPLEIFTLAKQIDGMPTANGTYPLAGLRAGAFLSQREHRPLLYEALKDPGQILDLLVLSASLRRGEPPRGACRT